MDSLVANYGSESDSNGSDSKSSSDSQDKVPKVEESRAQTKKPALPPPAFDDNSASIFTNPYIEAENAKSAILEKHVKMIPSQEFITEINGKKICWMYRKGRCRFGSNCKYAHDSELYNQDQSNSKDNPDTGQNSAALSPTSIAPSSLPPSEFPPHKSYPKTSKFPPHKSHSITSGFPHQSHPNTSRFPPPQSHLNTSRFPPHQLHPNTSGFPPHQSHPNTSEFPHHQSHPNTSGFPPHQSHPNSSGFPPHQSHPNSSGFPPHQSHPNSSGFPHHQSHPNPSSFPPFHSTRGNLPRNNEDGDNVSQKQKKRPGLSQNLVPGKKVMKMYYSSNSGK